MSELERALKIARSRKRPGPVLSRVYGVLAPTRPCRDDRHAKVYGPPERRGFNVFFCNCGTRYEPERWWHRALGKHNPFLLPGEPPRPIKLRREPEPEPGAADDSVAVGSRGEPMTLVLPMLYHWSPTERRRKILANGLRPFSKPTVSSGDVGFPYVSLSPTPSMAWGYSGDMSWVSEIEEWDLWQVTIPDKAEVHYRSHYGNRLEEVRVYSAIPADHVWYVATRETPYADTPNPDEDGPDA